MFKGERIVVGMTESDSKTERRFVFAAHLSDGDHKTFSACLNAIAAAN